MSVTHRFRATQVKKDSLLVTLCTSLLRRERTQTAAFLLQFCLELLHGLLSSSKLLYAHLGKTVVSAKDYGAHLRPRRRHERVRPRGQH